MDKEFASDFPNFFLPVAGSTIAENFVVKLFVSFLPENQ